LTVSFWCTRGYYITHAPPRERQPQIAMTWQSYLRSNTRNPRWLWRIVLSILAIGMLLAYVAEWLFVEPPSNLPAGAVIGDVIERQREFEQERKSRQMLENAIDRHDWWHVWWLIPRVHFGSFQLGKSAVGLFAGGCWLVFLLQAGCAIPSQGARICLCLGGLVLGAISVWPTLMAVYVQRELWQFDRNSVENLVSGLRYCILGIGLREELCKLLLLVPLVPWLMRRRDSLEQLIVAACVGVGFAAAENIGYLSGAGAVGSVSRFLIANFLHAGLTGLAGLWLCRALRWPKDCGAHFVAYFGLIVLAHALYDAVILIPDLTSMLTGLEHMIIFVAIVYAFFHELRQLRPARHEPISLTANFVIGLSLLTAVTFIYLSSQAGVRAAAQGFGTFAVGMSIMAYVYLREMPESMVRT